jgi:hypothetical protein
MRQGNLQIRTALQQNGNGKSGGAHAIYRELNVTPNWQYHIKASTHEPKEPKSEERTVYLYLHINR